MSHKVWQGHSGLRPCLGPGGWPAATTLSWVPWLFLDACQGGYCASGGLLLTLMAFSTPPHPSMAYHLIIGLRCLLLLGGLLLRWCLEAVTTGGDFTSQDSPEPQGVDGCLGTSMLSCTRHL